MPDYSHYEVIEHHHYYNVLTEACASIGGAVPWTNENDRQAWTVKHNGWTIRNPFTGQTGMGKPPFKTFQAACEAALKMGRPSRSSIGD